MKNFGHKRPVRDDAGAIIEMKDSPVRAVTREVLGRAFGPDHDKRLVVSLEAADTIACRPQRTTRTLRITAKDLWHYLNRCAANLQTLEKARQTKARKAERLARERQARREKNLFKK